MGYEEASIGHVPWFPNYGTQIAVAVGYLILLPAMTLMIASRFPFVATLRSAFHWNLPYSVVTILIAFTASWCYIFVGGVLNLGVGLSQSLRECSTGLFLCTWFYTTTKLGLYLFLMERAFIVRGGGVRLQSWHYRFNFFIMGCWLAVFILLETGRIYALRTDGVCTFGWEWWALIPLMALDVFVNFYLLAMFVVPLLRNQFSNGSLRSLAIRSMWTAVGSVIATISNLVMLIMIEAPGWLCLSSCGIDIFANAALLFYMTRTLRKDNKEAKAVWTVAQYNAPDTDNDTDIRLENGLGYSGSGKCTFDSASGTVDTGYNCKFGEDSNSGVMTTICEAKAVSRTSSMNDDDSQKIMLPSSSNNVSVSRKVEYKSSNV